MLRRSVSAAAAASSSRSRGTARCSSARSLPKRSIRWADEHQPWLDSRSQLLPQQPHQQHQQQHFGSAICASPHGHATATATPPSIDELISVWGLDETAWTPSPHAAAGAEDEQPGTTGLDDIMLQHTCLSSRVGRSRSEQVPRSSNSRSSSSSKTAAQATLQPDVWNVGEARQHPCCTNSPPTSTQPDSAHNSSNNEASNLQAGSQGSSCSSRIVGVPASAASGLSSAPDADAARPELKAVHMAASQTSGLRDHMEDYAFVAALDPELGVQQQGSRTGVVLQDAAVVAAAGVFDGHAGKNTADFAAMHTPQLLHMALTGSSPASGGLPRVAAATALPPEQALPAAVLGFDKWWATRYGRDRSGSTAVLGLVQGQRLYIGNTGDSPALLARGSSALRLSLDHRADNAAEMLRVLDAGGHLDYDAHGVLRLYRPADVHRTNGCMFTRSLGDFAFKNPQQLVTCEPHVCCLDLCPADRLVLLNSDGVTDSMPDDDIMGIALRAVEKARDRTDDGQALAQAAATEVMIAALEAGSTDNITSVAMLLDWQC